MAYVNQSLKLRRYKLSKGGLGVGGWMAHVKNGDSGFRVFKLCDVHMNARKGHVKPDLVRKNVVLFLDAASSIRYLFIQANNTTNMVNKLRRGMTKV